MDASPALDTLLDLTRALDAVITRETEILRTQSPAAIRDLQDEKFELATRYAAAVAALRQDPAALAAAPEVTRAALGDATRAFRGRLAGNARALDVARQVNERLIRAVGDAVAESRAPAASYSGAGARRGPAATALALDRRI